MSGQDSLRTLFRSVAEDIDEDFKEVNPVTSCAQTLHVRPSTIILPIFVLVIIVSFLTSQFAHYFITLFALLYPSYMSFKAINKNSEDACNKWLTYWIVFAFATVFDRLISTVLFFVPAFYTFKVLFFIWLFYPRTDGVNLIYQKFLKPQLRHFHAFIHKLQGKKQ